MHEICSIEKEIRELDNKNLELIEIERREVAQKIGELQKNNASEINKELLKKDRLYTKKLMDVESELISCLESRSKEIKDNLLKFFSK